MQSTFSPIGDTTAATRLTSGSGSASTDSRMGCAVFAGTCGL
jgi:hypothetical protein